jgi:hypothetical protein
MPTDSANEAHGTPFARKFQDSVTLIEYDGQPVVVARDLGAFPPTVTRGASSSQCSPAIGPTSSSKTSTSSC